MNTIEKKQVLIQTLAAIDNESVINELYEATILVLDNKLNTASSDQTALHTGLPVSNIYLENRIEHHHIIGTNFAFKYT